MHLWCIGFVTSIHNAHITHIYKCSRTAPQDPDFLDDELARTADNKEAMMLEYNQHLAEYYPTQQDDLYGLHKLDVMTGAAGLQPVQQVRAWASWLVKECGALMA